MATYRMDDGTVVKDDNAVQSWDESRRHDGHNWISVATGAQWTHQKLHKSRKGRYWLECWSDYQGTTAHAEWISNQAAAAWLIMNEKDLPEDLKPLECEVSE